MRAGCQREGKRTCGRALAERRGESTRWLSGLAGERVEPPGKEEEVWAGLGWAAAGLDSGFGFSSFSISYFIPN